MQVSGDIGLGEGLGFQLVIFRRLLGPRAWLHRLVGCLPIVGLLVLGELLIIQDSPTLTRDLIIWVGAYMLALFGMTAIVRWNGRAVIKSHIARGETAKVPATYSFEEQALSLSTPGRLVVTDWSAVSEIALIRKSWLFFGPTTYFLPQRLFDSPAAEREVIAFILAHLSPAAQARSKEARALVGGG